MSAGQFRRVGAGSVIAAVAAIGIVTGGASASSQAPQAGSGDATIKMKLKGTGKNTRTFFKGDKTVKKGAKLEIVNATDPKDIGPHTFSLVKQDKLPTSRKDMKACANEKNPLQLCADIIKAQEFDPATMKVSKPTVDVGKKGWDKSFGRKGDTWYTEAKGDSDSRKVSAPVGTTLYYFCAVHPEMQGKIKVVK